MLLPRYTPENWSTVPSTGLRTIYRSLSFYFLLQVGTHFIVCIPVCILVCLPCTDLALYQRCQFILLAFVLEIVTVVFLLRDNFLFKQCFISEIFLFSLCQSCFQFLFFTDEIGIFLLSYRRTEELRTIALCQKKQGRQAVRCNHSVGWSDN